MAKGTAFAACLLIALGCTTYVWAKDPLPRGVLAGTGHTVGYGELKEEWRGEVIHLSWSPRAFLVKGFLTDEECDHLISLGKPSVSKDSAGTFLTKGQDEIITRIEKRVAQVSMVPVENQEGFQVSNYNEGQKYEPHYDYFHDPVNAAPPNGGQRLLTMLMYLSTVEKGGETVFPSADRKSTGSEWSDCAKQGLAVKPYRGDVVIFYSIKPDGATDPASLHGSCPTSEGDKWSATKWIHVSPYIGSGSGGSKARASQGSSDCEDSHEQCSEWTFFGECEKNPQFMLATCKKSCKACGKH